MVTQLPALVKGSSEKTCCDFWARLVNELSARVITAEADADRLYRYALTGGDRPQILEAHLQARSCRLEVQ